MKSPLHRLTSHIKHYLASRYDLKHLKKIAFLIALMSCISLGSILLFPLFSQALHKSVGLSFTQINTIASLSAVGMYLCLPVLGYLADCYGPALLSLISIWAFCPAYFVNASLVKNVAHQAEALLLPGRSVALLAISFCFIGLATSSLYFSSLLTCARIYPNRRSLAISLPVSCYGLSSLIGAQVMKIGYFHAPGGLLDLYKVFLFFLVLYLFVGALNLVSNSIVTIEQEIIFGETEPLLRAADDEEDSLLPQRSNIEPPNHRQRYVQFLKDKSAWVLLLSLFFCLGPLESFQNNLGLIIDTASGGSVELSGQVSILAALSTSIRLLIGIMADWMSDEKRTFPVCKVWMIVVLAAVGAIGQIGVKYGIDFNVLSMINGISYGGLFTAYPTVIASIWGVDLMGSTWGSFMVAPAIGSITFSLLHGKRMDKCAARGDAAQCMDRYFEITGTSLAMSILFVLLAWRVMWWRRGFKCF